MRLPWWGHGLVWLCFAGLVLLPPAWLAVDATAGLVGGQQAADFLTNDQWGLLGRSLLIASGAAALALCLGAPYALLCQRTDLPGRRFWQLAGVLPLLIPPFVHALTWSRVTAEHAPLGAWLEQVMGWAPAMHSPGGAAWVLALAYLPFVILLASAGLRSIDRGLEEAALMRAGRLAVWARVTLPLVMPHLVAGTLFVLVFALVEFAVPDVLRVQTYPVEIFIELSALFDEAAATRLALPLLLVTSLLVLFAGWLMRGRAFVSVSAGAAGQVTLPLGRWRWVALLYCVLVVGLAVVVPLLELLRSAGPPAVYLRALSTAGDAILLSVGLAALGTVATLALGFFVALSIHGVTRGRMLLEWLSQLPFAVAPILLGIGLIKTWNHASTAWLYGSAAMLVIGYVARFTPYAVRVIDAALAQVDRRQVEAGQLAAGAPAVIFGLLLPTVRNGLLAAGFICFVLALGELGVTLLVAPPGISPIPIDIYNYLHYGSEEMVAALCLLLVAVQLLVGLLMLTLRNRPQPGNHD
jgi:iron(III) transport system permease protein